MRHLCSRWIVSPVVRVHDCMIIYYPRHSTRDSLTRSRRAEIGDRGKSKLTSGRVLEGVPPVLALAPAPAPASAQAQTPARTQAPALAQVDTLTSAAPNPGFSPSMRVSPPVQQQQMTGIAGDLAELASFVEKQQMRDDKIRAEMDAKMDEVRAQMKQHVGELTSTPLQPAVSAEQIAALQARIEQLHSTKLLSLDELYAAEDLIADWLELQASAANQVITQEMMYSTLSGS